MPSGLLGRADAGVSLEREQDLGGRSRVGASREGRDSFLSSACSVSHSAGALERSLPLYLSPTFCLFFPLKYN